MPVRSKPDNGQLQPARTIDVGDPSHPWVGERYAIHGDVLRAWCSGNHERRRAFLVGGEAVVDVPNDGSTAGGASSNQTARCARAAISAATSCMCGQFDGCFHGPMITDECGCLIRGNGYGDVASVAESAHSAWAVAKGTRPKVPHSRLLLRRFLELRYPRRRVWPMRAGHLFDFIPVRFESA